MSQNPIPKAASFIDILLLEHVVNRPSLFGMELDELSIYGFL
ncbi:MAG: hypothetical protein ACTHJ2_04405 [Candidatus Nitrosocosmicus sp.]